MSTNAICVICHDEMTEDDQIKPECSKNCMIMCHFECLKKCESEIGIKCPICREKVKLSLYQIFTRELNINIFNAISASAEITNLITSITSSCFTIAGEISDMYPKLYGGFFLIVFFFAMILYNYLFEIFVSLMLCASISLPQNMWATKFLYMYVACMMYIMVKNAGTRSVTFVYM